VSTDYGSIAILRQNFSNRLRKIKREVSINVAYFYTVISYCNTTLPLMAIMIIMIIYTHVVLLWSWGRSVNIVPDYRLENCGSIPGRGKGFFF
jgi:hypothetical protein